MNEFLNGGNDSVCTLMVLGKTLYRLYIED